MLNPKQEGIFNYLFKLIDNSGNGVIEEADFIAAFGGAKRNVEAVRTAFVDRVARRWFLSLKVFADTDHDTTVSQSEWQNWAEGFATALAETGTLSRAQEYFTDAMFTSIALGEASITKENYLSWFSLLGLNGDAEAIFAAMDTHKHNEGVVTKDEYHEHLMAFLKGEEGAVSILGDF